MFLCLLLLCIGCLVLVANAVRNVTVNVDSGILYTGAWKWTPAGNIEFFGTQLMVSQDPNAVASFNFTGIAVYYTMPASSLPLDVVLTLDGHLLDTLHASAQGQDIPDVIWSANGLENKSHTLEVSMPSDGNNVILERLIFTQLDDTDTSSSSSTTTFSSVGSSTSASPSDATGAMSPNKSKGHRHTIRIALGTALGVVGLLLIGGVAWYFTHREQRRPESDKSWTVDGSTPPPSLYYEKGTTSLSPSTVEPPLIPNRPNVV